MIAAADQDRDGLVSEEEFYQFVSLATAHWTQENWSHPLIYPSDFPLSFFVFLSMQWVNLYMLKIFRHFNEWFNLMLSDKMLR